MQRNDFLDFLKGSLITLVCIGHANQYVVHQDRDFFQDPLFKAIYMFHMPLFMAVAGYLSHRGITEEKGRFFYIIRRACSYLLPIFAWTILEHSSRYFVFSQPVNFDIIFGYTGLDRLWFLWALIESVVVTVFATLFGKYRPIMLLVSFVAILAIPDTSHFYLLKYVFPFFLFGFYLAGSNLKRIVITNIQWLVLLSAVASLLCFFIWDQHTYIYISKMSLTSENIPNIVFRWVAGGVASLFFVSFLYLSNSFISVMVKKIIILAGRDSIYIYILQTYIFLFLFALVSRVIQPISNIFIGGSLSIITGCVVTLCSLWIGNIIAQNRHLDRVLFGKLRPRNSTTTQIKQLN